MNNPRPPCASRATRTSGCTRAAGCEATHASSSAPADSVATPGGRGKAPAKEHGSGTLSCATPGGGGMARAKTPGSDADFGVTLGESGVAPVAGAVDDADPGANPEATCMPVSAPPAGSHRRCCLKSGSRSACVRSRLWVRCRACSPHALLPPPRCRLLSLPGAPQASQVHLEPARCTSRLPVAPRACQVHLQPARCTSSLSSALAARGRVPHTIAWSPDLGLAAT
mmetsp:Transcript_17470/g.52504  ORF Transcript_17470/g.52504 Transcript_17470/m.52504 type:complete len:226 (+) Transcript_17470:1414-2091(+)